MAPLGVAWSHWGLWGGFMAPLELWGGCMAPLGWWGGYMAPSGSACPPWRGCGKDGGSRWGPPPRQHPHPSTENGEKSGAEGAEGGPEPGAPEKRRKSVPRERKEPPAEGAFEFWTELEVQRVKFLVREGAKEGLGPPLPEHWDPPPHVQASHWDPHPWAGGSTMGPPSMGAYPWWVLRGGPGAGPPPTPEHVPVPPPPVQNYLSRNFYNLRFLALFLAFAINFILLFYKVWVPAGQGGYGTGWGHLESLG